MTLHKGKIELFAFFQNQAMLQGEKRLHNIRLREHSELQRLFETFLIY